MVGTLTFAVTRRKISAAPGYVQAAPDVEQGPLRFCEHGRGLPDLHGVALVHGVVPPDRDRLGKRLLRGLEQHVLGDVDEDGPGPAARRDVEGLPHDPAEVLPVGDEVVVLGDRARDADDVRLLEGVVADHVARDLAGDDHEGDGVEVRRCQARDRVGGTGAARDEAHPAPARRSRVPVRGVHGALLVARENEPDRLLPVQRVEHGYDDAAREAEKDIDLLGFQRVDDQLGPCPLHPPSLTIAPSRGAPRKKRAVPPVGERPLSFASTAAFTLPGIRRNHEGVQ